VTSDDSGAFVLAGLLEREYRLCALDPATLSLVEVRARPGDEVELDLRAAGPTGRLAGRVVDSGGRPLAGVRLRVVRACRPS
jgi:hypothetical protein